MNRRQYLATLLVVAAGCSGTSDQNAPTSSPRPTTTPIETTTTIPTTDPSPTTTASPTESEPTETVVESDAPIYIDRALEDLQTALQKYLEHADTDEPTLTDVTAASVHFSAGAVHIPTTDAAQHLDRAAEEDTGAHAETIADLRTALTFLDLAADVQARLANCYLFVRRGMGNLRKDEFDELRDTVLPELEDDREAAGEAHESLIEETEATAMTSFDGITEGEYTAKREQFTAELDAIETLEEAFPDYVRALNKFSSARRDTDPSAYEFDDFEDLASRLESTPRPESVGSFVDELHTVANHLPEVQSTMQDAAVASKDGNEATANQHVCDAEAMIEDCGVCSDYVNIEGEDC